MDSAQPAGRQREPSAHNDNRGPHAVADGVSSTPDAQRLQMVDARLAEIVKSDGPATSAVIEYVNATQGKRLRASLVFLCHDLFAAAGEGDSRGTDAPRSQMRAAVDLAAAVELVHLASLLHDDVVDDAGERRGMPTVARRWGAPIAVLSGDYLFAAAFAMLVETAQYPALGHLSRALRAMSQAEIEQQARAFATDAPEQTYWQLVSGKTGALFAAACSSGAGLGGAPPAAAALLGEFGCRLGAAFQAADDLLDITGDPRRLGKPVGQDLSRGFVTLPVIRLLAHDRPEASAVRDALAARDVTSEVVATARASAVASGAVEESCLAIRRELARARSLLDQLPATTGHKAVTTLAPLLDYVLRRDR